MASDEQAVRGAVREQTRAYIAETARNVAERLDRHIDQGWPIETRDLAQDVAWIARQLAKLAQ